MMQLKKTPDGAYMVADLLEKKGLHPVVGHHKPYWLPPTPGTLRSVMHAALVPTVAWRADTRDLPEGTRLTDIDANGAYLAAASSADFAHGALEQTGPHDPQLHRINPGYYLIDVHHWQRAEIGSPLGGARITDPRIWVTHVTYKLLSDLTYGAAWGPKGGDWPALYAYDTWTSKTKCRLNDWTNALRDMRAEMLRTGDREAYEALKLGYAQAVEMWATPPDPKGTPLAEREKKNSAYRPDWFHTVRSQHHFNMFYRAYRAAMSDCGPIQMGGAGIATDGMTFVTSDLTAAVLMSKSPLRLDDTGVTLGTFKRTRHYFHGIDEVDGA